ncbi:MAG: T9SS type A sorting domain-containing protein, partial [Methanococcaceae archaeon]
NDSLYPDSASPVIDAGMNLDSTYKFDKNGTIRPQFKNTDIGAYEYPDTAGTSHKMVFANADILKTYYMFQNYPNPFNPSTKIRYSIPEESHVSIKVYNILGKLVRELVNEIKPAGDHEVIFKDNDLASGTYIYSIKAGNFSSTRKMILLK